MTYSHRLWHGLYLMVGKLRDKSFPGIYRTERFLVYDPNLASEQARKIWQFITEEKGKK